MHERKLMDDLMGKIDSEARDAGATRVTAVRVRLGALSHFTEAHFREHFEDTSRGTLAEGAEVLWLVDAVSSGSAAGTVLRIDAAEQELPTELFRASTHHLGLAEAVELARALGRLPARTVFYGIEGASFDAGEGLSAEVAAAAARVAEEIRKEVEACTSAS